MRPREQWTKWPRYDRPGEAKTFYKAFPQANCSHRNGLLRVQHHRRSTQRHIRLFNLNSQDGEIRWNISSAEHNQLQQVPFCPRLPWVEMHRECEHQPNWFLGPRGLVRRDELAKQGYGHAAEQGMVQGQRRRQVGLHPQTSIYVRPTSLVRPIGAVHGVANHATIGKDHLRPANSKIREWRQTRDRRSLYQSKATWNFKGQIEDVEN